MKAFVESQGERGDWELITVNGHRLQYGGEGDGYCYEHQTFECIERLTEEEREAVRNATPIHKGGPCEV